LEKAGFAVKDLPLGRKLNDDDILVVSVSYKILTEKAEKHLLYKKIPGEIAVKKEHLLWISGKELRKRLVKYFVWILALYGTETWTLRLSEEKRLEAFEMWIWIRMERVKWTDRIRNEAVLERMGEGRVILKLIRKRKRNWLEEETEEKEDNDDDDNDDELLISSRTEVAPNAATNRLQFLAVKSKMRFILRMI
ncbi:hypothetical protein ANN_10487, partial [Periplaneta americana]